MSIVSIPSTMRHCAEMRRVILIAVDRGEDILALSDAQDMLQEIYPTAHTHIPAYTKTCDPEGQGLVLYRFSYVTRFFDETTGTYETLYNEHRDIVVDADPRTFTDPVT